MSRILYVLKGLKRSSHRAYLNNEFKKDVQWWINFLSQFHAISVIKSASWSAPDATIATDACLRGGGGTYNKRYFMITFPDTFLENIDKRYFMITFPDTFLENIAGITQLAAMSVIIALKVWGTQLQGLKFTIQCDNEATVANVNSGRSRDNILQQWTSEIAFLACKYEFETRQFTLEV